MRSAERRKVNVLEMKRLMRSFVGVSRMDRVRNEVVRIRAGIERELASSADKRVLRWFGNVERIADYRMARRVLMAEVSGGPVVWYEVDQGWLDGWCEGGLGQQRNDGGGWATMKDRKEWRARVQM